MIARNHKSILEINLNQGAAQIKISGDLFKTLGGVVSAYQLYKEYYEDDPIIFATGPLSGMFPYISKCVALYNSGGELIEKYGGGNISAKMNLANIDAIVLTGAGKFQNNLKIDVYENSINVQEIIPANIQESMLFPDLRIRPQKIVSQGYFEFGEIEAPIINSGEIQINIEYTESFDVRNVYDYEKLYKKLLESFRELSVDPANSPSCFGCPMGCEKSSKGEDDLNISVLPRCLVSCGYAASIYKHIPTVFACLQSIGYDYTHSDLERIPLILSEIKEDIFKPKPL